MVSLNLENLLTNQFGKDFGYLLKEDVEEIRLRINKPICIKKSGREYFLDKQGSCTEHIKYAVNCSEDDLKKMINHICQYSMYAYEEEIRQGFISIPGGHRVGITGQVVLDEHKKIKTITHVNGLNIRVSHQIKDAANLLLPYIYNGGKLLNTLIISPPGCGKTTILRDLIRQISNGNPYGQGICVGVVDERSEIAGCLKGSPQNDVGIRTDVLDACPKSEGILLLIRSMSPRVIAIDELGGVEDWNALLNASYCGVKILATMHGEGVEDYEGRLGRNISKETGIFQRIVTLKIKDGKHLIENIYKTEGDGYQCMYQY